VLRALFLSALFDGAAQALDYVGQVNGGYLLFTIFHSSVTIFSCAIAVAMLGAHVSHKQWAGILLIVAGILVTAVPSPIVVTGNFSVGLVCSIAGSLCLAASYPLSELVFQLGEKQQQQQQQQQVAMTAVPEEEELTTEIDAESAGAADIVRLSDSSSESSSTTTTTTITKLDENVIVYCHSDWQHNREPPQQQQRQRHR